MKNKLLLPIIVFFFSLPLMAETIELFNAIPGAILYEIHLESEARKTVQKLQLTTPTLETNDFKAGDYVMRARFLNVRNKWSAWTDKASLKIVKKIKSSTRDIFEDKFPFGASIGYSTMQTKLESGQYTFDSSESVVRTRAFIQRQPFKINVAYDTSQHFTRFDAAILKQIDSYSSLGVNFWMVNFDGRSTEESKGLINYTQSFLEYDFMYPFLDRWYFSAKVGLGFGISYYLKPELTYSIPFGKDFFVSTTVLYETAKVSQSDFDFFLSGIGALINCSYFLEM